jgi:uncharacterized protein (DUF169 family)
MQSKTNSTGGADGEQLDVRALAGALRDALDLKLPPVALSFAKERPAGIPEFRDEVPSACALWRRAEHGVFFASAETHSNCPIGVLTMGFSMSEEQKLTLMDLVGKISELGYIHPAEAGNIPSVPGEKQGIVYGPLESFPGTPDAVLLWVSGAAAMLLSEATGSARWSADRHGTPTFGRPSCGAIPMALTSEAPTFSLGCTGMRTFTAVDPNLQLAVLPNATLPQLRARLEAMTAVNAQMANYYAAQRARFTRGGSAA